MTVCLWVSSTFVFYSRNERESEGVWGISLHLFVSYFFSLLPSANIWRSSSPQQSTSKRLREFEGRSLSPFFFQRNLIIGISPPIPLVWVGYRLSTTDFFGLFRLPARHPFPLPFPFSPHSSERRVDSGRWLWAWEFMFSIPSLIICAYPSRFSNLLVKLRGYLLAGRLGGRCREANILSLPSGRLGLC
jgi:hypothetical protein